MKRPARWFIQLYPKTWRERYGEEFEALIEDVPPRWSTFPDLLKGAIQMRLSIPAFSRLMLLLPAIGLLGGLGASFLVTPGYTSASTVALYGAANLNERFVEIENRALSRTTLSNIIYDNKLDLYHCERENTPLEDVIERMRTQDLHMRPINHPGASPSRYLAFQIESTFSSPQKAQSVNRALIATFKKFILASQPSGDSIRMVVLDPPDLPAQANYPNRRLFAAAGFGAGAFLALIAAIFRRPVPPVLPLPTQMA